MEGGGEVAMHEKLSKENNNRRREAKCFFKTLCQNIYIFGREARGALPRSFFFLVKTLCKAFVFVMLHQKLRSSTV